jgi:hypothetical protein
LPDAPDSFEARVRQVIDDYLNDPVFRLPSGFKQWLPPFIELSGIQLPADSVPGSRVITSLDAVPEGNSGQLVTLRAGSSPYHFLQLTYDSTYQRWVSSQVWYSFWVDNNNENVSPYGYSAPSTTFTDIANGYMGRIAIPGFSSLYSAGLRPQAQFYFKFRASSGDGTLRTVSARLSIIEVGNSFTNYSSSIATTDTILSVSSNTPSPVLIFKTSGSFVDFTFSNTPSQEFGVVTVQTKAEPSGSSMQITDGAIALRWVSA